MTRKKTAKEKLLKEMLNRLNREYVAGHISLAYVKRIVHKYGIDVIAMAKPSIMAQRSAHKREERQVTTKKKNPIIPKDAIKIYDNIEAIEAVKGQDSLWPFEAFRHDFKPGSEVYGLPDGSILIINKSGKKLHNVFKYNDKIDGTAAEEKKKQK